MLAFLPKPMLLRAFVALLLVSCLTGLTAATPAGSQERSTQTTPKATTPKATTPKATTPAPAPTGEDTPLNLDGDEPEASGSSGGAGSLVRTIIGLAIVIGVIYGVTWVLKQMRASQEERATGGGLSSEATLPLGPGRSVHLIRAGEEYLLVGVAEDAVSLLRSYTAAEAKASGLLDQADAAVPAGAAATITTPGGSIVDRLRDLTVRR